jgi:hypothetical protein
MCGPVPADRCANPSATELGEDGQMALSVCLLPDETGERAVRRLWHRLEGAGVPTLLSHTHGRHVPHLTLAPRLTLAQLPLVAGKVNEVPPLTVVWTRTAVVHTRTGEVELLG